MIIFMFIPAILLFWIVGTCFKTFTVYGDDATVYNWWRTLTFRGPKVSLETRTDPVLRAARREVDEISVIMGLDTQEWLLEPIQRELVDRRLSAPCPPRPRKLRPIP